MVHTLDPDVELSNEYKLLLLCARTRMTEKIEGEIKSLIQQDIDWDYIFERSAKHRLTPLLYWQLNSVCPDSVPPEVMERLKTHFNENARKNLLFMGELQRILDVFKSNGIIAIPYKGPVLAIQAYGNLAFREFGDLDIFILKQDFQKVKELLISRSYQRQFQLDDSQEKLYLRSQREYKFINPETGINLEIHWNFMGLSFTGDWKYFEDTNRYEIIKVHERNFLSLKPEDMLLVLCMHASGHFWERLNWLCDIAEYIQQNDMDWQYLTQTARKMRISRILKVNLVLAVDLLDLNIPLRVDAPLKSFTLFIEDTILNGSLSLYNRAVWRFKVRENKLEKIKDVLRLIFAPTINEWKSFALPSFLYPLYYFLRPVNILRKNY